MTNVNQLMNTYERHSLFNLTILLVSLINNVSRYGFGKIITLTKFNASFMQSDAQVEYIDHF